jgi:hypothetical protein
MNPKMETASPKELPPVVNNSSLFTDYYLSELVKDDSFFQNSKEQAKETWRAIKARYEKVKELLPTANEAETERRFIRPVLNIIGYEDLYSLQPPAPSPEGIRRPDFAFSTSEEDLEKAEKHFKGKQEYFAKALAVGEVVTDQGTRERLFAHTDFLADYWEGADDPSYTLIQIIPVEVEYMRPGDMDVQRFEV